MSSTSDSLNSLENQLTGALTTSKCKPKFIPGQAIRQPDNAIQKARKEGLESRTIVQHFMTQIGELKYFERYRILESSEGVSERDLFFAHPRSLNLLKAFPHVLILDATIKTKCFKMLFLEVIGVTSYLDNFPAGCAFMSGETEDNYLWVLNQLQEMLQLIGACPITIVTVTNMNQPLLHALDIVFPHTKHILCRSHIYKNVRVRCFKETDDENDANAFVCDWRHVFEAKTEEAYHSQLEILESVCSELHELVEYVKQTWLNMYKERIVSAWTDDVTHFGTHSTDMIGVAHSPVKQFFGLFGMGPDIISRHLHSVMESQIFQIKERDLSLAILHTSAPSALTKIKCFRMLLGCLSTKALEILGKEYYNATSYGLNVDNCDCVLQKTHGLPCEHFIAKYMSEGRVIEPGIIHKFWWKPYFGEEDDGNGAPADRKRHRECKASPAKTFDESNKRALLAGTIGQSLIPQFAIDIPKFIRGYIHRYVDVVRDGHCGFRAIAETRGLGQDQWSTVRHDLLSELLRSPQTYTPTVHKADLKPLIHALAYYEVDPPSDRRFTLPDLGHLVATCYQCVFVVLGFETYMPLHVYPCTNLQEIGIISIAHLPTQDHFVSIKLARGSPLPPLTSSWAHNHHETVDGLDCRFTSNFDAYRLGLDSG